MEKLSYLPGQFISITEDVQGKHVTRAYSTASAPSGNRFELCLNLVPDGMFSPVLFSMQPGDSIHIREPLGYFTWRVPVSDSILVATGTGIAPFRAMLGSYLHAGGDRSVTLIFGVRYEEGVLYRSEFEELARTHSNFHFCPTLTRPGETWTGRTGRVQAWTLKALGERRDMDVYICGMKAMVDDLRTQLKSAGLDRKRIIYEKYD